MNKALSIKTDSRFVSLAYNDNDMNVLLILLPHIYRCHSNNLIILRLFNEIMFIHTQIRARSTKKAVMCDLTQLFDVDYAKQIVNNQVNFII